MNKIYLDKLCEFTLTTYKNYEHTNKNFDIEEYINNLKQNLSLNEKGIFLKHHFVELKSIITEIEYDQLVLINPLSFNLHGNLEWYNFLNSLLSVLNDNFIHENNLQKSVILKTADKTLRKKIIINDDFNDEIISAICIATNIILVLIKKNKINIFNYTDIKIDKKVVVIYSFEKEYYPVVNWNQKYFSTSSLFFNYLIELENKQKLREIEIKNNKDNFKENSPKKNKKKLKESEIDDDDFIKVTKKNKSKKNDIQENDDIIKTKKNSSLKNNNIFDNFNTDSDSENNSDNENIKKSNKKNKKNKLSEDDKINNNDINKINNNDNNKINNNDNKEIIKKEKLEPHKKGHYEELQADENYALYISEAVDNIGEKSLGNLDLKNNKKRKNIFITNSKVSEKLNDKENKNDSNNIEVKKNAIIENEEESSIFVKTEKLNKKDFNKKDIDDILANIKSTSTLEQIQGFALKIGIGIYEGSTKSGKPKNKTKAELISQIKEFSKNY